MNSGEHQAAEQVAETTVSAPVVAEAGAQTVPQRMIALQQRVGNAAFGQMIGRWREAQGRTLAREELPTEAEIAEAEAWANEGVREGKDLTPGAGTA